MIQLISEQLLLDFNLIDLENGVLTGVCADYA